MYKKENILDAVSMGARIRSVRERRKMTREVLAEKIDVSVTFVSDMEYGKKFPSVKTLYLLITALDVTADYLLSGDVYDEFDDKEAAEVFEELLDIFSRCSMRQLKSFRNISIIYSDILRK